MYDANIFKSLAKKCLEFLPVFGRQSIGELNCLVLAHVTLNNHRSTNCCMSIYLSLVES